MHEKERKGRNMQEKCMKGRRNTLKKKQETHQEKGRKRQQNTKQIQDITGKYEKNMRNT